MSEFSGWPLIGSKFARFGGPDLGPRLRRALNQWPDSRLLQLSRTLWIDANAEVVLIQKEDGTAVNLQVNTQIGSSITKDTASITAGIGLTTPANGIIVTNTDVGTPTFTDVIVLGKNSHGYMDAKKSDGSVIFKADPITETYQLGLSSGTSTTTIYGETLVLSVLGSGTCLIDGNGQITGVLESTVTTGTAPLTIASTTVNTNLNADLLDGSHASAFASSSHTHTVSDITGVLPVANGGTNASTASITSFNNITGYTAAGATGNTGTNLVFSTTPTISSPNLVTPNLGTPTMGTLTNCTGLPISTGVSGLGAGVATALSVTAGGAFSFVLFNNALGTPSSGTLTNCTGLPIGGGTTGTLAVNRGGTGVTTSTGSGNVVLSTSPTLSGVVFSSPCRLQGYTVATLPAGVVGQVAYVTDALAPAWNTALVGGGAVVVKCFYNGAAWVAS